MIHIYCIARAEHAPLYRRYHLGKRRKVEVGDYMGAYAREDRATGAEYRCLSQGERNGRPTLSTDLEAGAFYPENVFIWGSLGDHVALPHEAVEAFAQKLHWAKTKRVILPNGWRKGNWTWDNAVEFTPVENRPDWYGLEAKLKAKFPGIEILSSRSHYIEVLLEDKQPEPQEAA